MPRLDHVAIAAWKVADAEDFLGRELGGRRADGGPSPEFRWQQWLFADAGCVEILEPDDSPRGFVRRFLERSGPGIHHVTFKVESLDAACERAAAFGYDVVGRNDYGGWKEAFLHPLQAQGIVVQLAQSPGEEPQPPAPDEPEAARIVALRMRAGAQERALRQWAELLGGAPEVREGELRFRWPESPIEIRVGIEPDARDASQSIEISAGRPIALPSEGHPSLGARFVRATA